MAAATSLCPFTVHLVSHLSTNTEHGGLPLVSQFLQTKVPKCSSPSINDSLCGFRCQRQSRPSNRQKGEFPKLWSSTTSFGGVFCLDLKVVSIDSSAAMVMIPEPLVSHVHVLMKPASIFHPQELECAPDVKPSKNCSSSTSDPKLPSPSPRGPPISPPNTPPITPPGVPLPDPPPQTTPIPPPGVPPPLPPPQAPPIPPGTPGPIPPPTEPTPAPFPPPVPPLTPPGPEIPSLPLLCIDMFPTASPLSERLN